MIAVGSISRLLVRRRRSCPELGGEMQVLLDAVTSNTKPASGAATS